MTTSRKQFQSIDEFIGSFPPNVQKILGQLRKTIREAAPEADETISYGIPTFKLNGNYLVYFAAFKNHIGLYPPAPNAFKKEVSPYEGPKGNLKFPIDEPIPLDLVKRIVKYKVKEILEKAGEKKQKA